MKTFVLTLVAVGVAGFAAGDPPGEILDFAGDPPGEILDFAGDPPGEILDFV